MSKKNVPLLFGEVLFDVFEDKAAILDGDNDALKATYKILEKIIQV